jgi:hypothetical protein
MLAAFVVVMLGFWPTFYRPLSGGSTLRTVHGVTSTLWYLALVVQPWLVTHGYVRWHKRVAVAVIVLLPILCVSALMTTRVMLARSAIPAGTRPLIAYLDVTLVALFVALFLLGLLNRRTPAAHKRYMVSTALLGFPPALTRFISRTFAIHPIIAIHISFYIIELILITLIIADWRKGEGGGGHIPSRSSRMWRFSFSCSRCRTRRGGTHSVSGSPQVRWVVRHDAP